ncbi:MAG: TetR/AcrR family transcriptional regulator [Paracoccaceae bacterium]
MPDQTEKTTQTATPVLDRRRLRGDASAQRIIDATIGLIAVEGLAGVTMQRIAADVGSSNALVVFHFGSKDGLFRAVLQYLIDQYDQMWKREVRRPDLRPEHRLMGAVECARHFARQHPDWVAVWVAFSSDRKYILLDRQISLPNDLAYMAECRALMDQIAQTGGYGDVDTDTLAKGLNYLVHGAWFWDNIYPEGASSDVMQKTVMVLLSHSFPRHFPLRN